MEGSNGPARLGAGAELPSGSAAQARYSNGEAGARSTSVTGKVAWVTKFPYPGQGGALVTKTGIVFTSDLGGDLYAIDPKNGRVLWKANTGSSIVAPITAYQAGGEEYIVLLSVASPAIRRRATSPRRTGAC